MTGSVPSKLQHLWELFVQSPAASYTKSCWLDLFLAEFLEQVQNGASVNELLAFWPAGQAGIATLIGCELLGSVHQICSTPGQTEELRPLRNLLLRDRGWRCLAVLHLLSLDGICCVRELASLLISIYPVCVGNISSSPTPPTTPTTPTTPAAPTPAPTIKNGGKSISSFNKNVYVRPRETNIDQAIVICGSLRHKTHTPQRKHSHVIPPNNDYSNSNSSTGKGRRTKITRDSVQDSGSLITTTDSEPDENSLEALNRRSLTLKIHLNPMDFDYFTSAAVRDDESDDIDPLLDPNERRLRKLSRKQLSYDDFLTDSLKTIIKSTISQFEFSILVVQLLQSLCLAEGHILNDNNPPIAVQCINFALENLCSLQFGSAPTDDLTATQISELKSALTQLMLIALERVVKHADISVTIINNGILPVMLRILEDVTNKHTNSLKNSLDDVSTPNVESPTETPTNGNSTMTNMFSFANDSDAQKMQEFVFGIVYGILTFLYNQLLHRATIEKLKDFLELFRLFSDSQSGRLIEKTLSVILSIPNVDASVTYNRVKKIIDFLGQFIITLKKSRSEIIHSHQCHKTRHKKCRNIVSIGKHHHQDLFGAVYSSRIISSSSQNLCCISTLFMILVQLLQNQELKEHLDLRLRMIKIMILAGTCCCFPAQRLMTNVTKMLHSTTGKIRPLAFTLLERTLYSELGAVVCVETNNQCTICARQINADNQSMKYYMSGEYSIEDSYVESELIRERILASFYNSDNSMVSNESGRTTPLATNRLTWSFLEQYHSLINSADMKLSYAATSHLLRVAPRCTPRVRYEILFRVFFPTFLTAKTQYAADACNEHIKFKILTSLSLFASLLGSVPFAEQFVNLGGLQHLVDLINNAEFSKACCAVLENTVIIEIWKLESELNSENLSKISTLTQDNVGDSFTSIASDAIKVASSFASLVTFENDTDEFPKKLPSLEMLMNALQQSTKDILTKVLVNKRTSDTNEYFSAGETLTPTSPVSTDSDIPPACASNFSSAQELCSHKTDVPNCFIQILHNGSVFWRTTASLCLYSPHLRQYIAKNSVSQMGDELLWSVLQRITKSNFVCGAECVSRERRLLMKLFEAILTVKLTAPTQDMSLERICKELRQVILNDSPTISSNCVAELYDVLLRCTTLRPSMDQVMPPHTKPKMPVLDTSIHWEDETTIIDLGASKRLAFSDSSLAEAYITADEGYEADVEVPEYSAEHFCSRYETAVSLADSCSSGDSIPQLPACDSTTSPGFIFAEYCRTKLIVHPNLCLLALDLLITLDKKNGMKNDRILEDILLCLQRLLVLCRDNPHNCITLAYAGTIARLLVGFENYLISRSPNFIEIQHAILELITLLSKHSITRTELSLYLKLFKSDDPPLALLLEPLVALATASRPQPYHILCFPSASYPNVKKPILNENAALHLASNLRAQQIQNSEEPSAWSNYAVCLPINNDMGWSMWTHGYSFCFWMRHERPGAIYVPGKRTPPGPFQDSENYELQSSVVKKPSVESSVMHLVSVGNDALVVEMWTDSCTEQLIFKLARPELKGSRIIAEQTIQNCISTGQWHHLALNVRDNIQKRKIVIEITLLINGWKEITVHLPVIGLLPKIKRTCILLGQTCDQNTTNSMGSWFFGNLMLFRTPVFTKERAIYLVGLGPNYTSLTECEVGKQIPNFTSIFGPRTISSVIDWDGILDAASGNLKELQDNLLLSYNAQNPNVVNVYPQVVTNTGGTVSHLFSNQPGFRVVTADQRTCQQLPLALAPGVTAPLVPQHFQGLAAAASLLGGVPVFMFLFARVVELKGNGLEQGMALRLLLRLVQVDGELHAQFQQQDGYQLLLRVLASNRCETSEHLLKAILDICCDKPVLHYYCNTDSFSVLSQTDAIIVNPNLIKAAIGGWLAWRHDALVALLSVLHSLLRDDHPFREFNAAQLNRVHLVDALLSVCKEHFLYEENETAGQLPSTVCCSIVELIRSLMGAPPEFCHIVAVFDFLLLLHQASATYITHVRSSFYYLLNDAIPPGPNSSNPLSLPASCGHESSTDSNSLTHPVDPRKLNKALTNLKIQQRSSDISKRTRRRKKAQHAQQHNVDGNRAADVGGGMDSGIAGSYKDVTSSDPENVFDNYQPSTANNRDSDIRDFVMVYPENQSDTNIEVIEHSVINRTPEYPTISGIAALKLYEKSKTLNAPNLYKENTDYKNERRRSKLSEQVKSDAPKIIKDKMRNDSNYEGHYKSQWLVTEGLLLLLRDTLLVLPDTMSNQVLYHVVKPEVLLVMANHPASFVRTALVKVLAAYLQRSTEEELNKFIKNKYFYHLANQLSLFSGSRDLASACGALITRCTATLEEQIELTPWTDLSSAQLAAVPPILALLPKSLHDLVLMKDILTFITHLFTRATNAFRLLLDKGLVEVLLKTMVEVLRQPQYENSILQDLVALLVSVSSRCLSMPGTHNLQIVMDMHLQLHYLTLREKANELLPQVGEFSVRAQQCALFDGQLDALQEKLSVYRKSGFKLRTTTSYLASVLSTSYDLSGTEMSSISPKSTPGRAHRLPTISGLPGATAGNMSNPIGLFLGTSTQPREIPKTELCDRFKTLLIKCVEFLINTEPIRDVYPPASITETKLVRRVLLTLLQGLSNNNNTATDNIPWKTAVWNARGSLRKPTAELIVWLMAPGQPSKLRMFAIHSLREERNCRELINTLLQTHPQIEQKFIVYLWDLMYHTGIMTESDSSEGSPLAIVSCGLSSAELRICEELKEDLQCWGILSPHSIGHPYDQWQEEVRILRDETSQERRDWIKQNSRHIYRSLYKLESLTRSLTDGAMTITRGVVESQNRERKSFMEYMKQAYTERLQARIRWQHLIQQLTHERAVWYFAKSYPQSWQLDPTEGPLRVRKRLQRCHLNISDRFLLPEHQEKLRAVLHSQPLSYLMKSEHHSSASSLLIERLHTSEKVRHMCTAQVITPAFELPGELLIGECCLHFVPDDDKVEAELQVYEITLNGLDLSCMAWQFENIREIHNRRFQLQERAIEIFLTNGKTYLVAFPTSKDRDDFATQLSQCHLPNRVQGDFLNDSIQLWRQGLMTNWEYITQLNKMAGRSYNDLMQYPVFPFVLADYTSDEIDLCDHRIYRNFKKPMAVQDKKNEQHYINNYNYLKQAICEGMNSVSLSQEPYHYGSHYSNSGTVLHFLVRLPPFTKMFLSYQDNNFDIPDRTFHALHTTWRLTSCDSTTDVKELIPEFFYLPEFLQNNEGFNLGIRQNGERVNNVQLPPWSKGDARIFTLVHRQTLEADYVRENIPHWIDLVFGYKQTGKAAVEAINVFHPATYYGFNVEQISDPIERNAWETMVRTYGQTPRQLFRAPHPMVIQPLTNPFPSSLPPVVEGVRGLRWGSYVGSPEYPAPVIAIWKRQHRSPIATLVPISSNDVYGLPPHTAILLGYSKEKDVTVVGTTPISGSALITWGHSDNIVRIKLKKEHPPWPLVQSPPLDPMVLCASVPDVPQLWLGHNSGSIHVYSYTLWPDRGQLDLKPEPAILLGHSGPITTLALCPAFSIAVSGSQDGTTIIWDLNTLSYVRSIETENRETPVSIVTVSNTLGDIAISCNSTTTMGSILSVYTINCTPIKQVTIPERITAMCYSGAPEGVSVNVLATGLDTGVVRLWSSWDLRPVREIVCPTFDHPIISIAYSFDSQHLFVSASDGTVIIWENSNGPGRTPKFLNLTSL